MKRVLFAVPAFALMGLLTMGCASSHQEGVKSDYRAQWTPVSADTAKTTSAAEAVFKDYGLKDVSSKSTNVDGEAVGLKADGTKITASVAKTDSGSQVTVYVGKLGDPKLGAEFATNIKKRAEGK